MAGSIAEAYEWLMPLAPWENPETLRNAIDSLNRQTWSARRLVVSVDGQLPSQLAQVLEHSIYPVQVIEYHSWRGTGPTLAAGLSECHCKWVLRADADDRSVPKRAELQLNHLAENPHLAVLGGQLSENSSQKGTVNIRRVPQRPEQVKRMMNWRNPINHPTVALNRQKVILAGNYRASLSFEDWDLWLRLMNKGADLANLQDILVIAEVDSNHLARRHGIKYANHEFRFLLRCQRENMMTVWQTIVLVLMRIPWRLLPKFWLASVMNILRLQTKSRF